MTFEILMVFIFSLSLCALSVTEREMEKERKVFEVFCFDIFCSKTFFPSSESFPVARKAIFEEMRKISEKACYGE
jgi:hypothetical protein